MAKYKLIAYTEDYEEEVLSKDRIEDIDLLTKTFNNHYEVCKYFEKMGYLLPANARFKIVKTSIRENKKVVKIRPIILYGDYGIKSILEQGEGNTKAKQLLKSGLQNHLYSDKFYARFSKTKTFMVLTEIIPSNFKSLTTKKQIARRIYNLSEKYIQSYLNYRDLYFDIKSSEVLLPSLEYNLHYEEPSIYTLISSLTNRVRSGEITSSEARDELINSLSNISDLKNIELPEDLSIDSLTKRKK